MVALPNPTVDAIYKAYERKAEKRHSQRIGASVIGGQCDRKLWLSFRHVALEEFEGRMLRLFDTGHREEQRIIDDLRAAGVTVWDRDPNTGKQWEYSGLDGHVVAKLDAVVIGLLEAPETPHVLSCKSANKKNFDKIEKEGVEKAKPEHFAQMQLEMGLADLTRAVYFVGCKDDDRIYLERIHFDDKVFKALLLRANRIVKAESPPDRISSDPSHFVCRFCPFVKACHGETMPAANCRTCVHASPASGGTWSCADGLKMAPGCGEHLFVPDLLHWAEPIDGDPTWVKYKIRSTGREFINCADTGFPADDAPHYASRELTNCTPSAIGEPAVEAARTILGGKVMESILLVKTEPGT